MPTRNVVLTERQEALVEALVSSGRYQNASEVLREGLRLIEQAEAEQAAKLEALRKAARVGMEALERGDVRAFRSVDDLMTHLDGVAARAVRAAKRP
jgi:antitoxin ParD1/3/4